MKINYMRTCNNCGRPLEPGEACNCDQPVKGLPRDGLRATCPLFRFRSSHMARYYIVCGLRKTPYANNDLRNDHYRRYCCGAWQTCDAYRAECGDRQNGQ